MNPRERIEQFENKYLTEFATKSAKSIGRKYEEEPCEVRTAFQRDRDRIIHCKSFRRLMHKTQVFISPEGDHYRTRLTHTLEVSQIARTIARALRLNEDLAEAIALGHDLGHTPYGHTGEDALNSITGDFRHNEQSGRVVEVLENNGKGLNLSKEVVDGIINHRSICSPSTLEGKVVQLSDKIGYINHDIDDAVRAKMLNPSDLPKDSIALLGDTPQKRIDFLIKNVIKNSYETDSVLLEPEVATALKKLRAFMFQTVYQSQLQQKERNKIKHMLRELYAYYSDNYLRLPYDYVKMVENSEAKERVICDFIAGMTDRYVLRVFKEIFVPYSWNI